jgi:hypothetical protein
MKKGFLKLILSVCVYGMTLTACCLSAADLALADEAISVDAENFEPQTGIGKQSCDAGTEQIAGIESGDYAGCRGIDLTGKTIFEARVPGASNSRQIEIRLGSSFGALIGTGEVPGKRGFNAWHTFSCAPLGAHDVYLVFNGGEGFLFNVNWFKFKNKACSIQPALIAAEYFSQQSQGPFEDIGHYIAATSGMAPACFVDADGQAYLYYNSDGTMPLLDMMDATGRHLDGLRAALLTSSLPLNKSLLGFKAERIARDTLWLGFSDSCCV